MSTVRHNGQRRRRATVVAVAIAAAATGVLTFVAFLSVRGFVQPSGAAPSRPTAPGTPHPADPARSEAASASVPAAIYSAVIPELIEYAGDAEKITKAYHLDADALVYGRGHARPVAYLPGADFLGNPTVVVPVDRDGAWTKVLTPARVRLPSSAEGNAPVQSAGWVRTAVLTNPSSLPASITVSRSAHALTITPREAAAGAVTYPVGVGRAGVATPTGTGYLQERYLDAAQDQNVYPIQLTSLHSAEADTPYDGAEGGLIGLHYNAEHDGEVSHGCIRLTAAAIAAVNQLPLGTPITVVA